MCGLPSDLTGTVSVLSNAYVCDAIHKVPSFGSSPFLCDTMLSWRVYFCTIMVPIKSEWIKKKKSHSRHIFYVVQAVERVLEVAFRKIYVGFSPTIGTFLYVVQAAESVIAVTIRKKLSWFESHCRHISLYSHGSWTRGTNSLREKWCFFESHYRQISSCIVTVEHTYCRELFSMRV